MTIQQIKEGPKLTIVIDGRLDTTSAPQLEAVVKEQLTGIDDLTFDLEKMTYISSAGLRVLLSAQKMMNRQGAMRLTHVNEMNQEIFNVTGFSDIMTIV